MPHMTCCLSCKIKFPTEQMLSAKLFKTRNNRAILKGRCPYCNGGVTRMMSNKDIEQGITGSGLLGNLISKIPGLKTVGRIIPF